MDRNVAFARNILRYAFGLSLIAIGLDKTFHTDIFTSWELYVSPLALSILPVSAPTIVTMLGIAEVVLGILFFTRLRIFAATLTIITLLFIMLNLYAISLYDIALRDALIALAAYVFILLTTATEKRVATTR